VLVCRSPGYIEVLVDETTRKRGFTNEKEQKIRDLLRASFVDAGKEPDETKKFQIRDNALLATVDFVITDLKDTVTAGTTGATNTANTAAQDQHKKPGMSVGGWICIGLAVLL